ncbi:hypothetical protein L1987_35185 [Smallanthus sonchifolius]|uniref:Uncharacterized protein n=1 Tax=Smallanthus sonchifolius TaxID=185202 RepID=A0ACB9HXM7_9ASTR|nr:hypothetical protein L1987_35185 [Smallanthus sonchifolius]
MVSDKELHICSGFQWWSMRRCRLDGGNEGNAEGVFRWSAMFSGERLRSVARRWETRSHQARGVAVVEHHLKHDTTSELGSTIAINLMCKLLIFLLISLPDIHILFTKQTSFLLNGRKLRRWHEVGSSITGSVHDAPLKATTN